MTETEWLTATEPLRMVISMHSVFLARGIRKTKLLSCALVRQVSQALNSEALRFIEVAEDFSDGVEDRCVQAARERTNPRAKTDRRPSRCRAGRNFRNFRTRDASLAIGKPIPSWTRRSGACYL